MKKHFQSTLYQTTNFSLVQIESICKDKLNFIENIKFAFHGTENIEGKGKKMLFFFLQACQRPSLSDFDIYHKRLQYLRPVLTEILCRQEKHCKVKIGICSEEKKYNGDIFSFSNN